VHNGRLDCSLMLLSKPYRKFELASLVRPALADAAESLEQDLSPSLVHQSEFRSGGNPQACKRLLENENFGLGWSAAFVMRRGQGHFGSVRRLAGRGEADRRSDAADAVQKAIGIGDVLGNAVTAVGHLVGRDDRVCDLVLECGRKAVAYSGQAGFELIGVHVLSLVPLTPACASDLERGLFDKWIAFSLFRHGENASGWEVRDIVLS
jgi:hypothetical protein